MYLQGLPSQLLPPHGYPQMDQRLFSMLWDRHSEELPEEQ